jgi:hypothetical protein
LLLKILPIVELLLDSAHGFVCPSWPKFKRSAFTLTDQGRFALISYRRLGFWPVIGWTHGCDTLKLTERRKTFRHARDPAHQPMDGIPG